MEATRFEIVERRRERPFQPTDIIDFRLQEIGQLPANEILENPNITLYCLDFENSQAVFVETPADVDLSQESFYFVTQYETAKQVITISFETMIELAQMITFDANRLIFIHSVGRCGSTLASQIFAQIPGVINISEPEALMSLVMARNAKILSEEELIDLLKATICILCKTPTETAWVIKGRSYVIELGDWLHEVFPQIRNLFLYRDAETWLRSSLRAFGRPKDVTEEEQQARNLQIRERMESLVPSIKHYRDNDHISHASTLSLVWLGIMERYVQLQQSGIEMLAIEYASWKANARKTAEAMLEYCGCKPDDMTAIYAILDKDSQSGTGLSQDTLDQRGRMMTESDLEALNRNLHNHVFIHDADFEVSNTLKI